MHDPLVLNGLDANNPLAFLAALGTLRSLSLAWQDDRACLYWLATDTGTRPHLTHPEGLTQDALLAALMEQLRVLSRNPALDFANDLAVPRETFRNAARRAYEGTRVEDRAEADLIAAFGCDVLADFKSGNVLDTAWRTMSGAGHQHFLGFMRTLVAQTSVDQLHKALFAPWTYTDPGPSLRWDPADDRRYALRWNEPAGDPIRTARGANALAIQGLPLFPTQPQGAALETTGFSRIRRKRLFSWPIWEVPLPLDIIRSALALSDLQHERPDADKLRAYGITEVYRSERITQGKYRNFTYGVPL